jgi:hypothetical protein
MVCMRSAELMGKDESNCLQMSLRYCVPVAANPPLAEAGDVDQSQVDQPQDCTRTSQGDAVVLNPQDADNGDLAKTQPLILPTERAHITVVIRLKAFYFVFLLAFRME